MDNEATKEVIFDNGDPIAWVQFYSMLSLHI